MPGGHQEPALANVDLGTVEDFARAVLDRASLACPIAQAIWMDWLSPQ
jgi:hypothetical protein